MPRKSRSVTPVEVHGFVWWITSSVAFVLFLLWAYIPDAVLVDHGLTYYPSKYWAVALPTWLCVTVVYVYWAYESLNMMATPMSDELELRQDCSWRSLQAVGVSSHFSAGSKRIPPLVDIPPLIVSMVLQGGKSPQEAERLYMLELAAQEHRRQQAAVQRGGESR